MKTQIDDSCRQSLIAAYSSQSKHSHYQALPTLLKPLLKNDDIQTNTRHEKERFDFVARHLDISGLDVLDIGGNSGYFSFESLYYEAKHVTHFEGNSEHHSFVKLASKALKLCHKVRTVNSYFSFDGEYSTHHDLVFLLNVLHHTGSDYCSTATSIASVQETIARELNTLSRNCSSLVFQVGFNWQGNPDLAIFPNGTKAEVISFLHSITRNFWEIKAVGVPVIRPDGVAYEDLNDKNIIRNDALGEFLNRPLFILKSVHA